MTIMIPIEIGGQINGIFIVISTEKEGLIWQLQESSINYVNFSLGEVGVNQEQY